MCGNMMDESMGNKERRRTGKDRKGLREMARNKELLCKKNREKEEERKEI